MSDVIKETLISEKEFTETEYERLKRTLIYIGIWPCELDKIYMGTDLIENKIIDQQTLSNNRSFQWKKLHPQRFIRYS